MEYIEEIRKAAQCDAVKLHRKEIFAGDFTFVTGESFSDEERAAIELVRECYQNLDYTLMADCHDHPEKIVPLMTALRHGCEREPDILQVRRSELEKRVSWLPEGRKEKEVYHFIRAYAGAVESGQLLYQYCDGPGMNFNDFVEAVDLGDEQAYETALSFLKWCRFNLSAAAKYIVEIIFSQHEKSRDMLKMRAKKFSFKKIGEIFHISESKVSDIERNAKMNLYYYFEENGNMISRICADCNGESVVSAQTLEAYFGENTPEIVYLLKSLYKDKDITCKTFAFNKNLDAFVPAYALQSEYIRGQIERFSKLLSKDEFEAAVTGIGQELRISPDLAREAFLQFYTLKGRYYVRDGYYPTLPFREVVRKHFPDGIQIHSSSDINDFRRYMFDEFGSDLSYWDPRRIAKYILYSCKEYAPGICRVIDPTALKKDSWNQVEGTGIDFIEEIRKAAQCDAVKLHRKEILAGDFTFVTGESFSDEERAAVELVRECYQDLDSTLVSDCRDHLEKIIPLMTALRHACEKEPDILQVRRRELDERISLLPEGRKEKQVWYFIRAYAGKMESGQLLYSYCKGPGMNFCDFVEALDLGDEQTYDTAVDFLKWSCFDLSYYADVIIQKAFRVSRNRDIIKMRADNISLEETGENFHLVTGTIELIEHKARNSLYYHFEKAEVIMPKICAERNGDPVISVQTLETYFGDYTPEIVYILKSLLKNKKHECKTFAFDEYLDAFVSGNTVPSEFIWDQMKALPKVLSGDDVETAVIEMSEALEIGPDYVRKIISQLCSLKGRFYVKNETSSAELYLEVVKRYFPDGIQLYRKGDLDEFRRHMLEDFGIDLSSRKNTSLSGKLRDCCIPCGRGLYRAS